MLRNFLVCLLMKTSHGNDVSTKISKSIGILYKSRGIVKQSLLKQLYFSFIHCHLNYANIAWASTYKSKLEGLYRRQKHAARIINFKDRFTHTQPLLHNMKSLNIFQINLFHIIFFIFKCKKKIAPPIFHDLFTPKPENKYNIWSRGKLTKPFYKENVPSLILTIVVHIYGMNTLMIIFIH